MHIYNGEIKHKIAIGIGGASGSIYAKQLLDRLVSEPISSQIAEIGVVFSANARQIWEYELGDTSYKNYAVKYYENNDFSAPFASGSAAYNLVVVCPCSMGQVGRIAHGISTDLICRAADVALKERAKLILLTRDTPLSLIHINNMAAVTQAGAIVCPATPSFYSRPTTIGQVVQTVVDRLLQLAGFRFDHYSWGDTEVSAFD